MAQNRETKDKEMAARLKKEGVHRRTGKCAICYQTVPLAGMLNHYATHG